MAGRLWSRPASDPSVHPEASTDPVDRSHIARVILWLKVVTAVFEVVAGIVLLGLGLLDVNIGTWIRQIALRQLQHDPGDIIARHLIAGAPAFTRVHEIGGGAALAIYGALKGGVLLAVLRHHHRFAIAGSVLFTIVAVGAAVVLFRHPTLGRAVLGMLDVAVSFVMWREALSLRKHAQR